MVPSGASTGIESISRYIRKIDGSLGCQHRYRVNIAVHTENFSAIINSAREYVCKSSFRKPHVCVSKVKAFIRRSGNRSYDKAAAEDVLISYLVCLGSIVSVVHRHTDRLAFGMGAIICRIKIRYHFMTEAKKILCHPLYRIASLPGLLTHKVGV